MKTKEEILKELWPELQLGGQISKLIFEAMQLYSDQQNKELREELQSLIKELDEVKTSHYQKLDAQLVEDVERLTEENKELREWKKEQLEVWGPVADYLMTRKDIRLGERMSVRAIEILKNQDAEIQRLTKEVEELKDEQILNDEVEELKNEIIELERQNQQLKRNNDQIIMDSIAQHDELTRLRELLDKCLPHVKKCKGGDSELVREIDNALNHKP